MGWTTTMVDTPTDLINIATLGKIVAQELTKSLSQTLPSRRVFNLDEAAEYCGLTRDSFKKKVVRDRLRKVRLDKCWRFDKADLDTWIDSHKEQVAEEAMA
jgi:excisionase family DNA binding protein